MAKKAVKHHVHVVAQDTLRLFGEGADDAACVEKQRSPIYGEQASGVLLCLYLGKRRLQKAKIH